MRLRYARVLIGTTLLCTAEWAQTLVVSLAQAQQTALQNHPRIASATFEAQASAFQVREARSAYYPTVASNLTGVGTERGSVLSAGAVTTSSIYSRGSTDLVGNQLVTDFGRTGSLVETAKLRSDARNANVTNTRAQVLLEVQDAYYEGLAALAVQTVAKATLDLRRLTLRQVSALADSALRSKIDVSFAQVTVSQAELDLIRAENDARASHARLSAAMGYGRDQSFTLADEELPGPLSQDVDKMIAEALRDRPDLATLRLNWDALKSYADAERKLHNPSVTIGVVTGVTPVRDERLPETYNAAGFNMNIPVFNGGLFKARREEAESHAAAADKDVHALALAVARDVQVAWLDANDAFQRLDVTARMVDEANEALRLAQARYDNALGSIVELNQAQLNQTTAEIAAASAKYEYLARRANLSYAMGELR